jgi:hypothetical protein
MAAGTKQGVLGGYLFLIVDDNFYSREAERTEALQTIPFTIKSKRSDGDIKGRHTTLVRVKIW